ncbi:MAG: hypothetical protein KC457_32200, partial [Myxococcales bacterium]|nr:hypothetical protein [Myxococcales bacterium]
MHDEHHEGIAAAMRTLGPGTSAAATELGATDEGDALAHSVGERRRATARAGQPEVLETLEAAGALDALAADDASALPSEIRTRAQAWIEQLAAKVLASFPDDGVGLSPATTPE